MCPLTYLLSPLIGTLLPRLNRLLLGKFLIVGLVFDAEIEEVVPHLVSFLESYCLFP